MNGQVLDERGRARAYLGGMAGGGGIFDRIVQSYTEAQDDLSSAPKTQYPAMPAQSDVPAAPRTTEGFAERRGMGGPPGFLGGPRTPAPAPASAPAPIERNNSVPAYGAVRQPTRSGPDVLLLDETGVRNMAGQRVDSVENFSANRPQYSRMAPEQRLRDGKYGSDPARPITVSTEAGVQVVRGPAISREVGGLVPETVQRASQSEAPGVPKVVQDENDISYFAERDERGALSLTPVSEVVQRNLLAELEEKRRQAMELFKDDPAKLERVFSGLNAAAISRGVASETLASRFPALTN